MRVFFHVEFYLLSPRITDSLEANSCPMARIVWWTSISSKESSPSKLRSCSEERQWNRFSTAWTAWTEILQSWHVQNHKDCRFWWGRVSKAPLASPTWHLRKFRAAEWKKCCVTSDVTAFGTSITRLQQYLAQVNLTTNLSTFQWIQGAIETASHYDSDGDGKWSCPKLLHQWHQEKGWSSSGEAKIRRLDMIEWPQSIVVYGLVMLERVNKQCFKEAELQLPRIQCTSEWFWMFIPVLPESDRCSMTQHM